MKECSRCKISKTVDDFNRDLRSKSGRHRQCKRCEEGRGNRSRRAWALKNPGKIAQYRHEWRAAHPERARKTQRKAYLKLTGGRAGQHLNDDRAIELVGRYLKLPKKGPARVGVKVLAREYRITENTVRNLASGRSRPAILRKVLAP